MTDAERLRAYEVGYADLAAQVAGLTRAIEESRAARVTLQLSLDAAVAAANRRSDEVATEAAGRIADAEGRQRRRIRLVATVLAVAVLIGLGGAIIVRDIARRFDRQSAHLVANCTVNRTRTQAGLDLERATLRSDTAALTALTEPGVPASTAAFAHTVFDGRIAAEHAYLATVPHGLTDCEAYR